MHVCAGRKQPYNDIKDQQVQRLYDIEFIMNSHVSQTINHERLFQSLAVAYIVFSVDDPVFTILDENEAHAAATLVDRKQVIGRPLLEAFPDTSKQYKETGVSELVESIRRVIRTGKTDEMPRLKYDVRGSDGKYIQKHWRVTHHPIRDDDGAVMAVYQQTEDITDEVATERKLELTRYQLSQALASGRIGTWAWDIGQQKVFAGDNLARMFGIESKVAKAGLDLGVFLESVHPDDRKRVEREIAIALKTHEPYESEYRTINRDGDVRWMIARGRVEVEDGEPVAFPGVVVDITDRKNAENNLRYMTAASTQFAASLNLEETLNNIASMMVPHLADWCTVDLVDERGGIQQVAVAHKDPKKVAWAKRLRAKQGPPKMNEPTGLPKVLRTGEPEFYPDISDDILVAAAKSEEELKLLRDLGFSSVIIAPITIDGATVGAISFISAESHMRYTDDDLEMAKGLASRAAMAVENANLYRSAQRELKEREELQQQLEAVNEALESRVIERTKQLVTTNTGLEKEIRKRRKIERELQERTKNLARSNQELQDFAYVASHDLQEPLRKIQAFGDILEAEHAADLGDGAEYLARMRMAASRMSTLIQDLLAFSRVSTQPQVTSQVDLNVVVNDVLSDLETSIERNKGSVTVTSLPTVQADSTHMRQLFQNLVGNALKFHREGVDPIIEVSARPRRRDDAFYEIYIKDNGIGFDEKYLDRIFSVFQRLHGKDRYDGTGIGLAVCRKIAERYGGTIYATSKPGVGSTFVFKIPIVHKE